MTAARTDFSPRAFFDLEGLPFRELFEVEQVWQVLGAPIDAWLAANLKPGIHGRVCDGAWIVRGGDGDAGDVEIGEGSVIEPGAYVKGPCFIGRDVEIRHGAYVRGHAIIGDGCVIGHATEVKGAVFLPGAKAGHFAYVGDSVLGRDVNLGAGTKLANLRLRGDEVVVTSGGGARERTGLRKFGAILGDGVQTGCNSVTNPGTLLGPRSMVVPCAAVGGYHPPGTMLRG